MQQPIDFQRAVVHRFPVRNEILVDFGIPVPELEAIPRTKPVRAPGLNALALPPDPASEDVSFVRIKIVIELVEVNKLTEGILIGSRIGVSRLHPKIEFGQKWQSGHIKAGVPRGPRRIGKRRHVVRRERIGIYG